MYDLRLLRCTGFEALAYVPCASPELALVYTRTRQLLHTHKVDKGHQVGGSLAMSSVH